MNKVAAEILLVEKRLKHLSQKIKTINLLKGFLLLVVLTLLINVTISTLELLGLNSVTDRTILFYSSLVVEVLSFIILVLNPAIKFFIPTNKNEKYNLAKLVGNKYSEIDDRLLNALQLSEVKDKSELRESAILSQLKITENINFNQAVKFSVLNNVLFLTFTFVLSSVVLFYSFSELRYSTIKILNYSNEYAVPQKYVFYIEPQNISVTKGDDVKIKISVLGAQPSLLNLYLKDEENQNLKKIVLTQDSTNVFSYNINSIRSNTKYFVEAEDIISKEYIITVIDKPIISELEIKIIPPRYTRIEPTIEKDNGNINAIVGSKVKLNILSSKNLKSGMLKFNDKTKKTISVSKNKGTVSFVITEDKNYIIKIIDNFNNDNENPIEYKIKAMRDLYPTIEIIQPEGDVELNKTELMFSEIKIEDDFGFNKLTLNYKLTSTSFGKEEDDYNILKLEINKSVTKQDILYTWNLAPLMLAAGDVVSFFFEVFDNDSNGGYKSVKSKVFQLRVPTMEELFNSAELEQEETKTELEKTLNEAEKLKEEMKKLSNELKKDDKKITWEENKKLKDNLENLEKIQNQIKTAQEKLDKTKDRLEKNDLLSKETLEKYNELQKLMDEMNSEEMKNALQKLQQQMNNMNRNNAQKSLEKMEFNEELLQKSIERTVNLLKRIQIEQKMDEVIKRTEELQKNIDELKEKTEKSDLSDEAEKKNLNKKENQFSKQLEQLKKEMQKLQDKMNEFKEMPNDSMEQLQKEMENQKNEELTEEMKKMLQKNMKQSALEQMQQLSQNMQKMKNQMQQMQQQMQQENQMQVLSEMIKGINNLIALSKEQEKLKEKTKEHGSNRQLQSEDIQKQKEIMDGLDKTVKGLSELSQKTFAITPEMGKALGNAKNEMNNGMQAMQNKNSSMAIAGQKGSMKYLNQAATMMKGNMEQMMNGGQGGGMMSMMQQMQQLSQQQMGLNQLTKQMQQGRLTPQQMAGMERLSQQQELIRKSLEQLNKENKEKGVSKTLTSNLEKILEEMKELITNMNTNKVDDDVIKSQEKILSKLLDAQRSINERDFEKNRESNSGNNFNRKSPKDLKLNGETSKIKDELLKIINEGYSKDYEDLIRKYYEILEKEHENEISK